MSFKFQFFIHNLLWVFLLLPHILANPLEYSGNIDAALSQLGPAQQTSLFINKITFSCDIPVNTHELLVLTQLKFPHSITKQDIVRAYKNLLLKKRFQSIAFNVTEEPQGKNLKVDLTAHWLLKKLECDGVWFGKSVFTNLYLIQPGDIFDVHLHEESLKAIQAYLHDHGYFASEVIDQLRYAKKHKTLNVHLKIRRKRQFTITKASVVISDLDKQSALSHNRNINKLINKITLRFHADLEGVVYTKQQLTKTSHKIRGLLKKAGFFNARMKITRVIHPKNPTLDLTLTIELRKRKIITLQGNSIFPSQFIKDEFLGKDIPDWLFTPEIITQQLLYEYYKKGYWHTKVSHEKVGDVGYHFAIHEGAPTNIRSVEVIDSITHLPERSSFILNEFLKDKVCDQYLLDESLERLKNFYVGNGFWDFKILDRHFAKTEKGTHSIKVVISKGIQRLWDGLTIDECKNLETSEFFKKYFISGQKSVPFNLFWLNEQRTFLLHYFQELGYWYASVEPELSIVSNPQQPQGPTTPIKIIVHWKIKKGPEVKFGKTIVRGITTIPYSRIKKQCAFKKGSSWNREKLDQTRKRLKNLDVFKVVQVQSLQMSKHKSKKPILINIVDDDPVELRARIGYFVNSKNIFFKQQSTPKVGASFIIKNPTNRADRISMAGDWSKFESKFTMDYQLPSPFGLAAMSTLKGFGTKYIHPAEIQESGSAYRGHQYGIVAGVEDSFKDNFHWSVKVGNEWHKISRKQGEFKFDEHLMHRTLPYFFVEPAIEIDTLDNKLNPKQGSYTMVGIKAMVPENKGDLSAKLLAEQSLFYPFHEKLTIAGHVRLGHIFNERFDRVLPIERFYLGGPYSVRGYEPNSLPPFGYSADGKVTTIQGGSSMCNANLELRFPIYQALGAVLFQDIGVLSQSGFLGFKGRWYPGSGFGFRYKTPIGSIRFDLGWKWKQRFKEDSKSYAWYLTIGEAF